MEPARYTQEQETMIVKNAMELTATIMYEDMELKKTQNSLFRTRPSKPERTVLDKPAPVLPAYPQAPKTSYKYLDYIKELLTPLKEKFLANKTRNTILAVVLGIILIIPILSTAGILILPAVLITFVKYMEKCKEMNNVLSNSEEYLQARKLAEEKAAEQNAKNLEETNVQQLELDKQYEQKKVEYETVIIPKYEADYIEWSAIKDKKISFLQEEIEYNTEVLNELYDSSRIISARYRELWILRWLYEDMSTSDHDIRYATELLDRERQRLATEEMTSRTEAAISDMSRSLNGSMRSIYDAIEHGNALQEGTIDVLTKTRRDNNIGNIVGIAQRHNTNKMLETLVPKK